MMKKYLLFDLDRTLWDFDNNANITFRNMFEEFRLGQLCHTDYDTFHLRYRQINDLLWEAYRNGTLSKEVLALARFSRTLASFGLIEDDLSTVRLSQSLSQYYVLQGPLQLGLMPGARELLEYLHTIPTLHLSVITNGFSEAQIPKMKSSGIDLYFENVFLSEDLGVMKPDRAFFREVLKRLNASERECLVIGDDFRVDILGAASAGIDQVYYNPHHFSSPSVENVPTFEIHNLLELITILD